MTRRTLLALALLPAIALLSGGLTSPGSPAAAAPAADARPIKALLVIGGCCHAVQYRGRSLDLRQRGRGSCERRSAVEEQPCR